MSTAGAPTNADDRLRTVVVLAVSALLLGTLIVAASLLGTSIVGVPTYYGNGLDPALGAQVARDFLADQQAEASALSSRDQGPLAGHFTDGALGDVIGQMTSQSPSGASQTFSFQAASLTVLRATDANNPALTVEVQEDGTETVVTSPSNSAPSVQSVSFHGDYWLRIPSGSHYAIGDMKFQALPSSPLGAIGLVVAAMVVVAIAGILALRQRSRRLALAPTLAGKSASTYAAVVAEPIAVEETTAGEVGAGITVRTFGGLHVIENGKDWAQELMARPVSGFVWLRLLVAAVRDPAARPNRDEIAQQASPPVGRQAQLKRLRNVVGKGFRDMPPVLSGRIEVETEVMSFRLDGCAVDARDLLAMSASSMAAGHLAGAQVARAERLLQACRGDFLPEFGILENIATDRHPTCTALVGELRELLFNRRADLAVLVADAHLREGRPGQAIAVLEPTLIDRAERKDVADRLASAYRAAGRDAEAKGLAARYS